MKIFFTCLFLLSVIGINGAAYNKGFTVSKTPKYNDTMIKIKDWCDERAVSAEIQKQKSSFFVEFPVHKLVKKFGLKFYHGNENRVQYVKSTEDAPIPPLLTSINTVKLFISRMFDGHLQVLFTKEDKERLAASLPGGTVDHNEMACKGALRELREELGLTLTLDKLRFLGCLEREDTFAYRMSQNEFLYHTSYDDQEIICDGKEVKGIVWENVEDVLRTGKANGLTVLAHHLYVLQQLLEGKRGKPCVTMPDHRQLNPRATKDDNDIMIFCPAE